MSRKKRDTAVAEETEQRLSHRGAGTEFAQHDQFGILILRERRQPQQDFPDRGVNRPGDMACLELESGPDINHCRGLSG